MADGMAAVEADAAATAVDYNSDIAKAAESVAAADREAMAADAAATADLARKEAVALTPAMQGKVCRAAIAAVMGRDPSIIRVTANEGGIVDTRYTRDDGTVWKNRCRVEPGRVVWAAIDVNGPGTGAGRWRTEDEITFTADGSQITVSQSMMGESLGTETYTIE